MTTKLTNNQLDLIDELVENYQFLTESMPHSGLLRDARYHHTNMAAGGDGGPTGSDDDSTIRGEYYKGYPNTFFQRVCERMRWEY
jgi:hypothetical protein